MIEPSTHSKPGGGEPRDPETGSSSFPVKLGIVVCVILAILFLIKPVRSHLDTKRALESVGLALELSAKFQFDAAMGEIQRALQLAPDKFEIQHAAAMVLTQMGDSRGLAFWQSLLQTPRITPEDRKRFVELAIKARRLDLASPELATLLKENPNSPDLQVLEVRRRLLADDALGAATLAETWMIQKPSDDAAQFALGLARGKSPGIAARADGRRNLLALASGHGEWQIPALVELASDPGLNRGELQIVLRNLESKLSANPEDQLRIASLQLRLDPSKRPEIVETLVKLGQTVGSSQLLSIANWMELNGELKVVSKVVPMERAKTNGTLLVVRLQTLAWLGESAEVEAQLADTQVPIDELQRNILRATIAVKKTPPGDPLPALEGALKLAGTNAGMIANIASHAVRLQLTNTAVDIYSRLIEYPAHAQAASVEIVRLLEEGFPTRLVRDRLRALEKQAPNVGLFTMEGCYFDLLLRENVSKAREQLIQIAAKNSDSLRVRMSLALADLVQNNPKAAIDRIGDDKFAWSRAAPRWQAIHVAILGANGRTEDARSATKVLDVARLRPEEAQWIQPWR